MSVNTPETSKSKADFWLEKAMAGAVALGLFVLAIAYVAIVYLAVTGKLPIAP